MLAASSSLSRLSTAGDRRVSASLVETGCVTNLGLQSLGLPSVPVGDVFELQFGCWHGLDPCARHGMQVFS